MPSVSTKLRNKKFAQNIEKRGLVKPAAREEATGLGPMVIGFFLFVVVGSALFQIIRTATRAF